VSSLTGYPALAVGLLIVVGVLSPFLIGQVMCWLLEARLKRESACVEQLKGELFRLEQTRVHWQRFAEELGGLDAAGRRQWLESMRAANPV
jgi:hypothetical protein